MTPEHLKKIREAAEAATPGPWKRQAMGGKHYVMGPNYYIAECYTESPSSKKRAASAAFIAHANPETVIQLVDEVERLRAEVKELKSPDMFWNADDGERCFQDPVELIESIWDYGGERGGIVEVQCAVRVQNEFYVWRERDETEADELDRFDYFQVPAERGREITQGTLAAYWVAKFARQALGGTNHE